VRVSFLIPVYNEVETIGIVLERVSELPFEKQLVVVDDGSTDGTERVLAEWAARPDVVVIRQANRGKGAALRAGIPHLDGDVTVIQDADLEYDPADVPSMLDPLERGVADVVYGSRFSGGKPQRVHRFWHYVGNRMLTVTTNVLYDISVTDMGTGYKAIRTSLLRSIRLTADDFAIDAELTARICAHRPRMYEVPIAYYGRTYAEGKKIHWRHGFHALWVLARVRVTG
jgi:glycosyltransferase involved in cell wall biosynthesis